MRMLPRVSGRRGNPSQRCPRCRQGLGGGGGVARGLMLALCTARRKIPFRISSRSVVCTANRLIAYKDGHRMPWSPSQGRRVAPQVHCTAGTFGGSMLRPRRWWRPVRTSPLLSSRARESGRVSSQAEAGRQAQLSRGARALLLCTLLASYDVRSASERAWASCCAKTPWVSAMWPKRPGLTSFSSGFQRSPASLCGAFHWGRSTSPLGLSRSRNASGPLCITMCAAVEAARYAVLLCAGLIHIIILYCFNFRIIYTIIL
jgi:hypothetical protein